MSTIRNNIIANYSGKAWAAVINLACIPFYIKYMGMEAYGLVGFFATLQPFLIILDMGLSPTVNRELARYSVLPGNEGKMRDVVRTLEVFYWGMAVFIGIILVVATPAISTSWLKANSLPRAKIQQAVLLMGMSLVLQWPVGYYAGGLRGLQRQVLLNAMNSILWTIRGLGAVLLVVYSSDKLLAFFGWQLAMSLLNVLTIGLLLWKSVHWAPGAARFDSGILKSVWRLAFGMGAAAVTILLFNQMDKVILSRQISLSAFGYYSLAWQVVGGLFLFYFPIYSAFYPAITQAISQGDREELVNIYHKGCQLMSVSVLPVAAVIFFFSRDLLYLWTRDIAAADQCYLILSLLIGGAAFNGMFCMPYAVRQAAGSMRRLLQIFIPSLIIFSVLLVVVVSRYGMAGAALLFSVFSIFQVGIATYKTHTDLLPGEHGKWCIEDLGKPLIASVVTAGIGRWIVGEGMIGVKGLIAICLIFLVSFLSAACATATTRQLAREYSRRLVVIWGRSSSTKA